MATKISTIYTLITADDGPLKKGLASARTASIAGASKIQTALNKINFRAVGLAAVAFGGTIAYGMKKAVDAASALEEATGKFNVVFRDQLGQAEAWAKELVASYGLSSREAKQFLSSIQDLLKPMGVASDTAAKLSNEVVKLAVDLGSFNDQDTPIVMRDIQSALVGNYETMKKYGVVLNETVVKQEALRQGIIKGKEALTAAQKATIAYELIVKGSADAIGDRNRTAKGYANSMRQLGATMEEVASKIGDPLMPALADVARGFSDWATENNKLLQQDIPSYTRKVGEAITGLVSALGPLMAMYDKLPAGTTGALGAGIIGSMLFGGLGPGFVIGSLAFIAQEVANNTKVYKEAFSKTIFGDIILGYQQAIDRTNDLLRWLGVLDKYSMKVGTGMRDALSWKQKADSGGAGFSTGGGFGGEAAGENPIVNSTLKSNKKVIPVLTDMWATYYDKQTQMAAEASAEKAEVLNSIYPESNKKTVMVLTDMWATYNTEQVQEAARMSAEKAETLRLWEEENKKSSSMMIELSERTAWAMQENFSNVFFDAMTGELKTFGDYAKSILTSIQRAIADITSQLVTEGLFGPGMKGGGWLSGLGSLFGGGSSSANTSTIRGGQGGGYGFANGGYIGEPVRGFGMSSGKSYEFDPNEIVTPAGKAGGVQVAVNVVNNLGQEADVSQSSSWISPDQMVTDIILNKKMTSRGFRQGMRA